ncbi:MAG: response regulator [Nitrospiria bacterium]
MENQQKFCICCGEEVPYNKIIRDGNLELTCAYCGFVLDVKMEAEQTAASCIITVDDSRMTREFLEKMLNKSDLAETVIATEGGAEFLAAFTKRLAEKQPVDLAILDLEMPVMDGITVARALRSVEEMYHTTPTPILVFSVKKCDDALKQQLGLFAPASYINKGSSSDPAQLKKRIDKLVTYLLNKRHAAKT